jgi:ABC-type molybdate transport system substrate-binding protein
MTIKGQPMVYGFTIPDNSGNPALARKFAEFMLDPDGGLAIVENFGQKALNLQLSPSSVIDPGFKDDW